VAYAEVGAVNEVVLARGLYRGALFLVLLVAGVLVGVQLKWVLVQLFAAAIVAAAMQPIVARLTDPQRTASWRWRPPVAGVVVVVYLLVGVVVLVLSAILLRLVLIQGADLALRAPDYAARLQDWYTGFARNWGLVEELDLWDMLGGTSALTQWIAGAMRQVLNVAGLLVAVFGGAINIVFVLFIALYLTVDAQSVRDYLLVFLPANRRLRARRILSNISTRLGQWVVGQIIACVIFGIGAGLALAVIGVPGATLLALIWAVCVLIPGIGPFLSAVPTIVLGFVVSPTVGVLATIFAVVWSQLENNVLVPRVMGHTVKLNPLVVLVAVLIGAELLGVAGALFAIPLAAALAVVVDEVHHERLLDEEGLSLDAPEPVAIAR
jgi:predicted PurR-regulated permease PerM